MQSIMHLLAPNASLVIFEHNPYNPVTRYMVHTCPFDRDAVLLRPAEIRQLVTASGIQVVRSDFTLFFPAFLRGLRPFEPYLRRVPLGGQYVVQGILN